MPVATLRIRCESSTNHAHKWCQNKKTVSPAVQKKLNTIHDDIVNLREKRQENYIELDTHIRSLFKKELDSRKELFDKWSLMAKDDVDMLQKWCKEKAHKKAEHSHDEEVVRPPAAEAYYEPWVKDD